MILTRFFGLVAKASLATFAFSYARKWLAQARGGSVMPQLNRNVDSSIGERTEPRGWPADWEHSSEVENPGDPGPAILVRENSVDPREDDRIPLSRPAPAGV